MDYDHPTILTCDLAGEEVSELYLYARDHFICGEELSISGRWVQYALHPMLAVGKELKYEMVFGDWKATAEHDVDFVQSGKYDHESEKIIPLDEDENGAPRVVGEAKTPWNHDFLALWEDIQTTKKKLLMSRALGQIGNYMIELQLKYGVLTDFDLTFFLKREIVNAKEILYCSAPIEYDASPLYGNDISLRQSLLLLQSSVVGNDSVWKTEKTSEVGIIRKKKTEKLKETKRRVDAAVDVLESNIDDVSHKLEDLTLEGDKRRARFDPNPVSDPPSCSSTPRTRRR
ncbi:hypothetical protein AJ80_03998 [Polytolypa hystricis UAMH7299]|uniref:Uncharacterized protein n=1 Tax=Polytolypa hystricis (strain UAMH7299) TaxID=1447883 RepID=A0A2B7YEN2_POLH7|nr:hypothetical protein AJ80_03998 [Polytolypa hystricis UAMH7299]